jgi:hypothetical protein
VPFSELQAGLTKYRAEKWGLEPFSGTKLMCSCLACLHVQVLERLSTYLPEEQRSRQALLDLAHSPQFQQQLSTFSGALQTGQLDLAQFGLQAQVWGWGLWVLSCGSCLGLI